MRALLLVLDSVGIGGAPDAANYGDEGANTLGHILERLPELRLPNLDSLGLAELVPAHRSYMPYTPYKSSYGKMQERSPGKDTTTGHWEIAGVILEEPFATFERFPDELVPEVVELRRLFSETVELFEKATNPLVTRAPAAPGGFGRKINNQGFGRI